MIEINRGLNKPFSDLVAIASLKRCFKREASTAIINAIPAGISPNNTIPGLSSLRPSIKKKGAPANKQMRKSAIAQRLMISNAFTDNSVKARLVSI